GYSFDEQGLLRPHEAVAEAFAEVRLVGRDQASAPARALYDLLTRTAESPPAQSVRPHEDTGTDHLDLPGEGDPDRQSGAEEPDPRAANPPPADPPRSGSLPDEPAPRRRWWR
ncbi:hypothetical protein ACLQ3L_36770, partial [Nocardia salmonicida]